MGVAMMVTGRATDECHIVQLPLPNRHDGLLRLRVQFAPRELLRIEPLANGTRDGVFATVAYYERYVEHQGFWTNKREFISREEALVVAKAAHQLIKKTPPEHKLFSEDCW